MAPAKGRSAPCRMRWRLRWATSALAPSRMNSRGTGTGGRVPQPAGHAADHDAAPRHSIDPEPGRKGDRRMAGLVPPPERSGRVRNRASRRASTRREADCMAGQITAAATTRRSHCSAWAKGRLNRRFFMVSLIARPNLYAVVQFLVFAGFQFLDCFPGRGIWRPHIEWQSAAKHDLAQEHGDRIGGAHAHCRKHPGGPRFEFRLYPRRYKC
jgi:hypothetical protein